jgi:hypothetical protein
MRRFNDLEELADARHYDKARSVKSVEHSATVSAEPLRGRMRPRDVFAVAAGHGS